MYARSRAAGVNDCNRFGAPFAVKAIEWNVSGGSGACTLPAGIGLFSRNGAFEYNANDHRMRFGECVCLGMQYLLKTSFNDITSPRSAQMRMHVCCILYALITYTHTHVSCIIFHSHKTHKDRQPHIGMNILIIMPQTANKNATYDMHIFDFRCVEIIPPVINPKATE